MKKKISIFIITLLFLTGCTKKAITVDEFTSSFDTNTYTVNTYEKGTIDTIIDGLESGAYITNGSYTIDFYILENSTKAHELFMSEKEEFEANKDTEVTENKESGKNYEIYELTTSLMYMYTSRIDNTLIYISANKEDKNEIKDLIKKLGY